MKKFLSLFLSLVFAFSSTLSVISSVQAQTDDEMLEELLLEDQEDALLEGDFESLISHNIEDIIVGLLDSNTSDSVLITGFFSMNQKLLSPIHET